MHAVPVGAFPDDTHDPAALHASMPLHTLPSEQLRPGAGVCTAVVPEQLSSVQGLPSSCGALFIGNVTFATNVPLLCVTFTLVTFVICAPAGNCGQKAYTHTECGGFDTHVFVGLIQLLPLSVQLYVQGCVPLLWLVVTVWPHGMPDVGSELG